MTEVLDQKEAVSLIKDIKIIPNGLNVFINVIQNKEYVTRTYNIDMTHTKYNTMNTLIICYLDTLTRISIYKVYLTDNCGNEVILCQDNPNFITNFFENIILLEMKKNL